MTNTLIHIHMNKHKLNTFLELVKREEHASMKGRALYLKTILDSDAQTNSRKDICDNYFEATTVSMMLRQLALLFIHDPTGFNHYVHTMFIYNIFQMIHDYFGHDFIRSHFKKEFAIIKSINKMAEREGYISFDMAFYQQEPYLKADFKIIKPLKYETILYLGFGRSHIHGGKDRHKIYYATKMNNDYPHVVLNYTLDEEMGYFPNNKFKEIHICRMMLFELVNDTFMSNIERISKEGCMFTIPVCAGGIIDTPIGHKIDYIEFVKRYNFCYAGIKNESEVLEMDNGIDMHVFYKKYN